MSKILEILNAARRSRAATCLNLRRLKVDKGETIFHEGEDARHFGILLTGSVNVVRYSADGRARVLTHLKAGESFGTSFALGGARGYFANVEAAEPTEALLVDATRLLAPCSRGCALHMRLLTHLLGTLAQRNTVLARKIDCLTQPTTREKLMAYLRQQAEEAGSRAFEIPFSRQQLADYLNVDRAALSTEIGKLVRDGRIETTRARFRLT